MGRLDLSGVSLFLQDGSDAALQGFFLLKKLGSLSEVVNPASEPPLVDPDVPEINDSILQDIGKVSLCSFLSLLVSKQVPDSDNAIKSWEKAYLDDGVNVHESGSTFNPLLSGFLEHVLGAERVSKLWGDKNEVDVPPPVHPVVVVDASGSQGEAVSSVSPPLVEGTAAASVVSWLLWLIVFLLKLDGFGKLDQVI